MIEETNDWTERVDRIIAPTVHEQLRAFVQDAGEKLEKFTASTSEQGGLLLDAQREMEATFERRITEVTKQIEERLAAMEEAQKRFEASIMRQLERTVGMEDRAAARMVDLLAAAFAGMRRPPLAAVES
jgi:hypothetical protein